MSDMMSLLGGENSGAAPRSQGDPGAVVAFLMERLGVSEETARLIAEVAPAELQAIASEGGGVQAQDQQMGPEAGMEQEMEQGAQPEAAMQSLMGGGEPTPGLMEGMGGEEQGQQTGRSVADAISPGPNGVPVYESSTLNKTISTQNVDELTDTDLKQLYQEITGSPAGEGDEWMRQRTEILSAFGVAGRM